MKYKVGYTYYVKNLIDDSEIVNDKKVMGFFPTASLAKKCVRELMLDYVDFSKFDNYDGDYLVQEYFNEDKTKHFIREFLVLPVGVKF